MLPKLNTMALNYEELTVHNMPSFGWISPLYVLSWARKKYLHQWTQRLLDRSITLLMYKENNYRIYQINFALILKLYVFLSSFNWFSQTSFLFIYFLKAYSMNSYSSYTTIHHIGREERKAKMRKHETKQVNWGGASLCLAKGWYLVCLWQSVCKRDFGSSKLIKA